MSDVEVTRMQSYVAGLVHVCGGKTELGRQIGYTPSAISGWISGVGSPTERGRIALAAVAKAVQVKVPRGCGPRSSTCSAPDCNSRVYSLKSGLCRLHLCRERRGNVDGRTERKKRGRNAQIALDYLSGTSAKTLAAQHGISRARVYMILADEGVSHDDGASQTDVA